MINLFILNLREQWHMGFHLNMCKVLFPAGFLCLLWAPRERVWLDMMERHWDSGHTRVASGSDYMSTGAMGHSPDLFTKSMSVLGPSGLEALGELRVIIFIFPKGTIMSRNGAIAPNSYLHSRGWQWKAVREDRNCGWLMVAVHWLADGSAVSVNTSLKM